MYFKESYLLILLDVEKKLHYPALMAPWLDWDHFLNKLETLDNGNIVFYLFLDVFLTSFKKKKTNSTEGYPTKKILLP